jgi:saccharopine dehydrogenase-like NADP-dependent oxidoreductase
MHYALIGAGSIGRALARDILEQCADARFSVFDIDDKALGQVVALSPDRVQARVAEGADSAAIAALVAGADVVVNCTAGAQCIEILEAAIAAKVPYLDVHGTLLLKERLALSADVAKAGILAMIGVGVSPGLTNMLGAYLARKVDGPADVECEYATLRPLNPTPGLLETVLRQMRNGTVAPVYENGRTEFHPPFSGARRTRFPGLDQDVELVYTPHSEPLTMPLFVPNVRRVTVRGTYTPPIQSLMKSLYEFGLLDPALQVEVDGRPTDFQPLLRQALMGDGKLKPQGVQAQYVMRVRVAGGGRTSVCALGHPPGWDALPQGRMTALPASYFAQLMARRAIPETGVYGTEVASGRQVEECLEYLQQRGLWVVREEE